jgi:hypothetical protein
MKAKFFLALLALNGLLLTAHSASANSGSTGENRHEITQLSRTISELVKLDPDAHSLVEMAINRALIAQKAGDTPDSKPPIAGGIPAPDFTTAPQPQPIVNDKIANPNPAATKPRVRRIVKPSKLRPDRQVRYTAGTASQFQPLRPDRVNSIQAIDRAKIEDKTNRSIQPSAAQIDRPDVKKLSQCKDLTPNNNGGISVNNSTNSNQPKVTIPAPISAPTPQTIHFVGARG